MNSLITTLGKREISELDRHRHRKLQTHRQLHNVADLTEPAVDGIADMTDNTLFRSTLDNDLTVKVPEWNDLPEDGDEEWLQLQTSVIDDENTSFTNAGAPQQLEGPLSSADFPIGMQVPKARLPSDGFLWVRYELTRYSGYKTYSLPKRLICDSTPPWGHRDQPTTIQLPPGHVDDDYFAANPEGLAGTLPAYSNWAPGDRYELFYFDHWPSEQDDYSTPHGQGAVTDTREALIPKQVIQDHGDGHFYVVYYLFDKAGNRSRLSLAAQVDVVLGALPDNLHEPVIPLAQSDDLIDLEDAVQGITVEIPAFDNFKKSDTLEVTWGSSTLPREPIGSRSFPIPVPVPNAVLHREYGGASGELDTTVSYKVYRGEVSFGPRDVQIAVDFSVVGPERPDPDPEWPNPENPNIGKALVHGADENQPNTLRRTDGGNDATFKFPLYDGAENGHVVDIFWDGTRVPEAQYIVDLSDGPEITRQIPWHYILAAGNNPALPVHYSLREKDDATNEQRSPVTLVDVDAITLTVPEPTFLRLSSSDWLNCDSLWADPQAPSGEPAFQVQLPDLSQYLAPDDEVTLEWRPLAGNTGDDEIPQAVKLETLELRELGPERIWEIKPYADHILPLYNPAAGITRGRGRVRYSFMHGNERIYSEYQVVRASLATGNGACPIP